jgi:ER membrane protein complex subunit 1
VANENGQIQSFPRLLLDPRRTKDKPTTEEQEEWLVQYDPVLPDDAHRVLSHDYHVRSLSVQPFKDLTHCTLF